MHKAQESKTVDFTSMLEELVCPLSSNIASLASDGRPELYNAQHALWELFVSGEEPDVQHVVVATTQPVSQSCEQVCHILSGAS